MDTSLRRNSLLKLIISYSKLPRKFQTNALEELRRLVSYFAQSAGVPVPPPLLSGSHHALLSGSHSPPNLTADSILKQQFRLSPNSMSKSLEQAKFIFPPTSMAGGTGRLGTPAPITPPTVVNSPPNSPSSIQSPVAKTN